MPLRRDIGLHGLNEFPALYSRGKSGGDGASPHRRSGHRRRHAVPASGRHALLPPVLGTCRQHLAEAGIKPWLRTVLADSGYVSEQDFARADADGLRAPLAIGAIAARPGGTAPAQVYGD